MQARHDAERPVSALVSIFVLLTGADASGANFGSCNMLKRRMDSSLHNATGWHATY